MGARVSPSSPCHPREEPEEADGERRGGAGSLPCTAHPQLPAACLTSPRPPQHMREAAERRQQLELEHEQALAVLNAKQQEIDLLQKVRAAPLGARWGGGQRRAGVWDLRRSGGPGLPFATGSRALPPCLLHSCVWCSRSKWEALTFMHCWSL